MTEIADRVFAITGAASGIGRALAVEISRLGGHLALSDVNEEGLDETVATCEREGVDVTGALVDVADRDAIYDWCDDVVEQFGRVNGIVNNAGVALRATVEDMDLGDFEWLMNINFWGVVHGTRAFLPHLRDSGEGHVVNISSVFGIMGVPTQSAYNAAKFAVRGFTESLRTEMILEEAPVSVTCVHPGGITTNIVRNGRMRDMSRFADRTDLADDFENRLTRTSPDDAGKAIVKGIRGDHPRVLIGADARLIDTAQRLLPTGYQRVVASIARRQLFDKS